MLQSDWLSYSHTISHKGVGAVDRLLLSFAGCEGEIAMSTVLEKPLDEDGNLSLEKPKGRALTVS